MQRNARKRHTDTQTHATTTVCLWGSAHQGISTLTPASSITPHTPTPATTLTPVLSTTQTPVPATTTCITSAPSSPALSTIIQTCTPTTTLTPTPSTTTQTPTPATTPTPALSTTTLTSVPSTDAHTTTSTNSLTPPPSATLTPTQATTHSNVPVPLREFFATLIQKQTPSRPQLSGRRQLTAVGESLTEVEAIERIRKAEEEKKKERRKES